MSPKINNIRCGAQGHVRKSRNHTNERFEGSPISKPGNYKFELTQDNTTELLKLIFSMSSLKNCSKSKKYKNVVFLDFFLISLALRHKA